MTIRISQRHLKILETCPRQFEYTYCDRLTLPMNPTQQVKITAQLSFHPLSGANRQCQSIEISMLKLTWASFEDFEMSLRYSQHGG